MGRSSLGLLELQLAALGSCWPRIFQEMSRRQDTVEAELENSSEEQTGQAARLDEEVEKRENKGGFDHLVSGASVSLTSVHIMDTFKCVRCTFFWFTFLQWCHITVTLHYVKSTIDLCADLWRGLF